MQGNEFYEELKEYAQDSKNYKKWRKEHTKVFGSVFADAFSQSQEAQICLTAALINISQRNFNLAMPKLDFLEAICENDVDKTAVYYFKGLNHEMLGDEQRMTSYYEKLKCTADAPKFILAFHPYYRTAKFAQRASECSKSMYYYRKALEFYEGVHPDAHVASIASHILYDIATLCLYMHEYGECERLLHASYQYDSTQNNQREYMKAVLLAVQGKQDECNQILEKMHPFFRENCQATTAAILSRRDLHYCIVPQDRSLYEEFWASFLQDEKSISDLVQNDRTEEAQALFSQKLSNALTFVMRTLECRIETREKSIAIKCKNYRIKSLVEEYRALFALKPENLTGWTFMSVEEFEIF